MQALRFDLRRGSASVGAHVRDAACYVCWAFARAYAPAVIEPFMGSLSQALVVASVYDREINCRRAASAAFQENVGRQGTFPHGIDILTRADYYTLGNRANAYLEISVFVAQYVEYRYALIDFLAEVQLRHWDKSVRGLSASALRLLTKCDPGYMVGRILSPLLEGSLSPDLPTRHGCTLALAECVLGFSDARHALDEGWHARLIDAVPQIEKARLYRGRGGEIMRGASCRVVEALALGGVPLTHRVFARLMDSVDENLKHPTEDIQQAAVGALRAVSGRCFPAMPGEWRAGLVGKYLAAVRADPNPAARRGFALALGALDRPTLDAHLGPILAALVGAATEVQERAEDRDAESRRNAVVGLADACRTAGFARCYPERGDGAAAAAAGGLDRAQLGLVLDGLMAAMEDYCADHRGDVGSWVREAAMRALGELCRLLAGEDAARAAGCAAGPALCGGRRVRLVCALAKQLGEKIDRVRECAGGTLSGLLLLPGDALLGFDDADRRLLRDFAAPRDAGGDAGGVDWSAPSATFPRLAALLDSEVLLPPVLSGMLISIGGLTESLCRHAWESLERHLRRQGPGGPLARRVGGALLDLLARSRRNDRVALPLLKTLGLLLSSGCLDALQESDPGFCPRAAELVQLEIRGSRDVSKVQAGAGVLCALLAFRGDGAAAARGRCLRAVLALLCHRFPKVRKHAAEQLYVQLLVHEDLAPAEGMAEAWEVLSDTDWFEEVDRIAGRRDSLYGLLGVERDPPAGAEGGEPAPSPVTSRAAGKQAADGAGYQDLVKEMHF